MENAFQDKIVVITGGGSGIGKALAEAFDRMGAIVAVVDLNNVNDTKRNLEEPRRHLFFPGLDVTNETAIKSMITQIKEKHGQIDLYFSNAGILFPLDPTNDSVTKHSTAQWSKILRVNLLSHVIALRALLPDWECGKGDGHFCITASAAGLLTSIGDASYGVSKAAAVSLAEHLAISHHPTVKVHCLCPQAVDTPFVTKNANSKATPVTAAMVDGFVSAEYVAKCTCEAILRDDFYIFPHARVPKYFQRKASDHDRWLSGMKKLRKQILEAQVSSKL